MSLELVIQPAGLIGTNAYLLLAPARGEAVLIDAPRGVWPLLAPRLERAGCRLVELWLTHGHFDHMDGAAEVVRATGAKVRAHPADREMLANPGRVSAFLGVDLEFEPVAADVWLAEGDRFEALGEAVEVRHVPGHCAGNVLFYLPGFGAHGSAFVGDAIFAGSVGRTDLPGGSFEELERSIRTRIYTLPDETALYPGHGGPTTVATEKATNPYVRP